MTPFLSPIARACAIAADHLSTKTMGDASRKECQACMRDPLVRGLEVQVQALCLTGQVEHVQQLLQDLNKAYRTALQRVRRRNAT